MSRDIFDLTGRVALVTGPRRRSWPSTAPMW